jgi:hypothetical protein
MRVQLLGDMDNVDKVSSYMQFIVYCSAQEHNLN